MIWRRIIITSDTPIILAAWHVPAPAHQRQGNHDFVETPAESHHNGHGQHQGGDGPHDIHNAHQHLIDNSAVIAGYRSESDPDQRRDADHKQPDFKGGPRPPDHAVKDIVLAGRGAENMGFAGRFGSGRKAFVGHQIGVVVVFRWCDLRRKNGHGREKQNQGKPDNGRRVSENPVQRKFKLTQSGMSCGHM
jgi:hypothetical protein